MNIRNAQIDDVNRVSELMLQVAKIHSSARRDIFKEKNIDPRCLEFKIIDTMSIEKAQVCHGGVSLKEVDENLQLKKYPGIYVCGEALDVDGDCGGYNLHFAFASGVHVAKSIKK